MEPERFEVLLLKDFSETQALAFESTLCILCMSIYTQCTCSKRSSWFTYHMQDICSYLTPEKMRISGREKH